jgi:hypothetical protein
MKSNIEKVYSKLPKTELATEKVELGVADDLKKYTKGFDKYKNEGDGLVKRSERLLSELKETQSAIYKWSDVGESISKDIIADMNKFEKAAKEIGVDPKSVKEYAQADKTFTDFAKLEREYQKIAKGLIK